ncbi:MAG: ATP-binding cassette domain-containing protein [Rhizobiaceae bacterium]|nr:ATP-binding cassette domain-containing protein [Rhizobiaceae bacterium]
MDSFFRFFEKFAQPFDRPDPGRPPEGGLAYIAHYARQVRGGFMAMLFFGGATALIEATLFILVGSIVDMMNSSTPESFWNEHFGLLVLFAVLVGVVRSAIAIGTAVIEEQIIVPEFFTLVRWQGHKAVAGQDISFFDDQLAGRVSSKVWQSGQAAGDFMVSLFQIIWFIAIFAMTALIVIANLDWRMLLPVLFWLAVVGLFARYFVPRIRDEGRKLAESATVVTGRMVDGYSNIRTVKLYGAEEAHDQFILEAYEDVLARLRRFTRIIAGMRISNQTFSSCMLVIIGALALWLFSRSVLTAGEVATVLALCLRLNLLLGRLLGLLNGLFRNFGTVQNSAQMISRSPQVLDKPNAVQMRPVKGNVTYDKVNFAYTGSNIVLNDLNLTIPAGQKVGIVGQSGVGKTTLMNLLLRFHDIDGGEISLDGTDIASVTQHSLRLQMGVVTQDTSLLHRSIRDNIAYGRPAASMMEIETAAKRAKAHEFIVDLEDIKGRTGYDTHVGERGVKLSGGQRQRIALARVFLKDAPILLLDEATSALDSEVEAAIQENLADLMEGKTVIAIAHRLSTIAHLDRLIVMEEGRIVEDGDHQTLLGRNGQYARLWERQSGGFLAAQRVI